ncbi:MAG: hypothetical protein IKM28_08350 [Lachnospiraceae bacterium]|nr:hypothetical protein [Lachnospiraceae bacterium]
MKVLKEKMKELLTKAQYIKRKKYEDKDLNDFLNYWNFFEEREEIIQGLTNESIQTILYSKYYWCSRYKERYMELFGLDASVEQQQYKILEELDQRINGDVDWNIIKLIEENNV